MTTIQVLLFFHILGAFMIVAGAALGETVFAAMRRTRDTKTLMALININARVPMMTIPGAVIALIFGSVLVTKAGFEYKQLWVTLAYISWIVAIGLSAAVLGPAERKLHALAEAELAAGHEESPALAAAIADPKISIVVHLLSAIVLFFLVIMVFRPGA